MYIWTLPIAAVVAVVVDEDPLVTDRPDFTESAIVVPLGRTQWESGFTLLRAKGIRAASGPEILVRSGVAKNWEIRVGAPDRVSTREDGERQSGWSDPSIGFKRQFGPTDEGVDVAIIVASSLPTGTSGFGAKRAEPEMRLCASKAVSDRDALSGMLAAFWPAEGPQAWQATLSLGRDLGNGWGFFLEGASDWARHASSVHTLHAGFTFRRTPNEQWDVHFGGSPNGQRERFFAAGYSVRR